jgi:hypothetical protein
VLPTASLLDLANRLLHAIRVWIDSEVDEQLQGRQS